MWLLIVVPFGVFFTARLAGFVAYERLVKRQYKIARDNWEADGRPPGFFLGRGGYIGIAIMEAGRSDDSMVVNEPCLG
jgi:hypothetical protein